jgi:hypothetical protein
MIYRPRTGTELKPSLKPTGIESTVSYMSREGKMGTMWRSERMIQSAIDGLAAKGIAIAPAGDIPGLFNIQDGPEITIGQLIDLARQNGVVMSADHPRGLGQTPARR